MAIEIKSRFTGVTLKTVEAESLSGADLSDADLSGADLRSADLRSADLEGAHLEGADLEGANLEGADLRSAHLEGAHLRSAHLPHFSLVPAEGAFIAYKSVRRLGYGNVVITVEIPADAQRTSSLVGRKCRASALRIVSGPEGESEWRSRRDGDFVYRLGETVTPDAYDDDIRVECTSGLHFFITRREAKEY